MLCFYQQTLISPPPCLSLLLFVCMCVCTCVRVSYDKCALYHGVCVCAFLWVCACVGVWNGVVFLAKSSFLACSKYFCVYGCIFVQPGVVYSYNSCWPALNVTVLHNRHKYTKNRENNTQTWIMLMLRIHYCVACGKFVSKRNILI